MKKTPSRGPEVFMLLPVIAGVAFIWSHVSGSVRTDTSASSAAAQVSTRSAPAAATQASDLLPGETQRPSVPAISAIQKIAGVGPGYGKCRSVEFALKMAPYWADHGVPLIVAQHTLVQQVNPAGTASLEEMDTTYLRWTALEYDMYTIDAPQAAVRDALDPICTRTVTNPLPRLYAAALRLYDKDNWGH